MITKQMLSTRRVKIVIFGSAGLILLLILYFIIAYFIKASDNKITENNQQSQTGVQNSGEPDTRTLFTGNNGTGTFLQNGGDSDSGEIVSRSSLREKLKHVPVSEVNGVPTSAQ